MAFVIFCARSCERLQRHFWADFWVGIVSCCVKQWKLNLELWSRTNATTVAIAKITGKRGWRVEKKCLHHFLADQKIVSSGKKCLLGHTIARATSYCLLPDTFWLWASKNAFKVDSIEFVNSVTTFHCEESTHWKWKQPRDLSNARQKSRELTTQPEPPICMLLFNLKTNLLSAILCS